MWFRFPEGTTGISVHNQDFGIEVKGEDGRDYFRAPDHFAPLILDVKGFESVGAPPNTDLPDLPQADPERDTAIVRMTAQIAALEMQRDSLLAETMELRSQISLLTSQADPDAVKGKKA